MDDIVENIEENERWYKGPIKYILAVFLILLLIGLIVPYYAIKLDPSPSYIPSLEEVIPDWNINNYTNIINNKKDYAKFVNPSEVKIVGDKIVSLSCDGNKICQAKALYYFVKNNYDYISDPIRKEYVEDPREFLSIGGGDCESGSIALASLFESIGIETQLVFISGHAYLRIYLPQALNRYKINEDWIYLDWTCKNCEFGKIPWKNVKKEAVYLDV